MNANNQAKSAKESQAEKPISAANDSTFNSVFGVSHKEIMSVTKKEFSSGHINLNPTGMVGNSIGEMNYYLPKN